MAANVYDWSKTAASNSNADSGINWAEGQDPGSVNDSARQMMGRVAEFRDDITGTITAGGTANALTVTANSGFTTLANGRMVAFIAASDNTGAATLNVNGIGAKSIRRMDATGDVPLVGTEIQAGGIYIVQYNTAVNGGAGGWSLVNPSIATTASVTVQTFTGNGTWTKPIGCRRAIFEAVGGGGGSGGAKSASGGGGSGAGGSGFYGLTGALDVSAVVSAAVTIGVAGNGGLSSVPNPGGTGGNTAITIGATTYTWGGGGGGAAITAGLAIFAIGGAAGSGTNVIGGGAPGETGMQFGSNWAAGGVGGSNPLGSGGRGAVLNTTGGSNGSGGAGFGSGGGGSATANGGGNADGASGGAGYMRVWEFY
jgi:hypothetical protein